MTQHGSNPDRPRGRRARPGSDWAGYDAVPQDEREFPDLQPIRPRERRGRHASAPAPDLQRGPSQAPQGSRQPSQYGQYSGPPQASGQHGGPPQTAEQYSGRPQAATGRHSAPPQQQPQPFQEPLPPRQPSQQPSAHQQPSVPQHASAPPQAPPAPQRGGGRPGGSSSGGASSSWDDDADSDDPMMAFTERWARRGRDTPGSQRKRRWVLGAGGGVVAIGIALAIYFLTAGGGSGTNTGIGSLVTTFLPGELQQVPNACTAVPSGTLAQDLPGPRKQAGQPLNTGAQSECSWTLDSPPTYRVLEVNLNAYSPSSLASGDGSATFAAEDAFAEDQNAKQKPGPKSGQPPATVASISNLGSSAFSATQQFDNNGTIVDVASVYVRYHNVIIEIVLNGTDHTTTGKQYGPVSQSTLLSQAETVAKQVTSKVTG